VNGTFEPTEEMQNGLPVYKMKGNDGLWVEAVKGKSGWRWYVKPAKNKGPDSPVCFAYIDFTPETVALPPHMDAKWSVSCAEGFVAQDSISIAAVGGASDRLEGLAKAARVKLLADQALLDQEVGRSCIVLCCAVLYCAILCYTVLCYSVCCVVLCCVVLYCVML